MKRILISLLICAVIFSMFSVSIFAEDEIITEDITEDPAVEETNNIFTRLWEYIEQNKEITLETAFSVAIFLVLWLIKKAQTKMKTDIAISYNNSASVATSQNGMVGVINNMIEGYASFKAEFDKLKNDEEARDKQLASVMLTNTAILEILSRVYPNSKNLPQGVKDVVNLTYANVQKAISDDETLASVIGAAKTVLTEEKI